MGRALGLGMGVWGGVRGAASGVWTAEGEWTARRCLDWREVNLVHTPSHEARGGGIADVLGGGELPLLTLNR